MGVVFPTSRDNDVFDIDICLLRNVPCDCSVGLIISYDCILAGDDQCPFLSWFLSWMAS
jgi:hypothetical protein